MEARNKRKRPPGYAKTSSETKCSRCSTDQSTRSHLNAIGTGPGSADPTDSQFAAPNPNRPKPKQRTPRISARPQPQQLNRQQIRSGFSSIRGHRRRESGSERGYADAHAPTTLAGLNTERSKPKLETPAKRPTLRKNKNLQGPASRPYTRQERSGIKPRQRLGLRPPDGRLDPATDLAAAAASSS